ncbi:MAG: hypothetical protein M3O70_28055 [Actinomycetota bacterium]|nr:hypothetical protein [Actinomycetota bacterium]
MTQVAALARIGEVAKQHEAGREGAVAPPERAHDQREGTRVTDEHTTIPKASAAQSAEDADWQLKAATRAAWALGDYHRFAKELVWGLGPVLVNACGISAG